MNDNSYIKFDNFGINIPQQESRYIDFPTLYEIGKNPFKLAKAKLAQNRLNNHQNGQNRLNLCNYQQHNNTNCNCVYCFNGKSVDGSLNQDHTQVKTKELNKETKELNEKTIEIVKKVKIIYPKDNESDNEIETKTKSTNGSTYQTVKPKKMLNKELMMLKFGNTKPQMNGPKKLIKGPKLLMNKPMMKQKIEKLLNEANDVIKKKTKKKKRFKSMIRVEGPYKFRRLKKIKYKET